MRAFIIMYNRLTWPKQLAMQLEAVGCEVVLVDNGSTYEPLLNWYHTQCPYRIIMMKNRTTWAEWIKELIKFIPERYFILTDHDLDIGEVHPSFIWAMEEGLRNNNVVKCGLGLKIPSFVTPYTKAIQDHEKQFKVKEVDKLCYEAPVSTTLALYDQTKLDTFDFTSAVRLKHSAYEAKHLTWYLSGSDINTNKEHQYYYDHSIHKGWNPLNY